MPEGRQAGIFAAHGVQPMRARRLRPASSQSPNIVSAVRSPRETNSQTMSKIQLAWTSSTREVPAGKSLGQRYGVRQVGKRHLAGVAAVDVDEVESVLGAPGDEPRQHFTRIAREQMDPAGKFALQERDALRGVGVLVEIDAIIFEPRIAREREQRAMAGVDADLQQSALKSRRAPKIASGGRKIRRRQASDVDASWSG